MSRDQVSPPVRNFINQFQKLKLTHSKSQSTHINKENIPKMENTNLIFQSSSKQNINQFKQQIVDQVLQEINDKQALTQISSCQRIESPHKTQSSNNLSSAPLTKRLTIQHQTIQIDYKPEVIKSTEDDDSFIRYIQYNLVKKNSQRHLQSQDYGSQENYSQFNYENQAPSIPNFELSIQELRKQQQQQELTHRVNYKPIKQFEQRQDTFTKQKEQKIKKQLAQKELKQMEEDLYITNYLKQKAQLIKQKPHNESAYNRLYQDATRRQDRRAIADMKLNQQREVICKISTDRRIMNNLAKLKIPQDILNSILKI